MRRSTPPIAWALFVATLTGCSGGSNLPHVLDPNPTPGSTLTAMPTYLTYYSLGLSQTVDLTQSLFVGPFTASGCPATVVTTSFDGRQMTVTSVGDGTCSLTVTGGASVTVVIPVTVAASP